MNRIDKIFNRLMEENRAALITFIMGGDPDMKTTAALIKSLPDAGADIIEIGIPFSDPMADGPVIQAAGRRALKNGTTVAGILQTVKTFRTRNKETPIILMGYYNPIYRFGEAKFCKAAARAGVDGLIIVDLPPEEERDIRPHLDKYKLNLVRLVAPTSDIGRLPMLMRSASGFIYYIAVTGVTGGKSADLGELDQQIDYVREFTDLPVAVGFGVKTPEHVANIAYFADAVVVGSALVDIIAKKRDKKAAVKAAENFVRSLAQGLWG